MKKKAFAILCTLLLCCVMTVFSMSAAAQEAVADPVPAETTSAAVTTTTASADATTVTTEPVVGVETQVYDLERDGYVSFSDGEYGYEDYYEDFYGDGSMYDYDYDDTVPVRSGLTFGRMMLYLVIGAVSAIIFMSVTKNNYKHAGAGTVYSVTANTKLDLGVRRDQQIDERVSIDRGYYSK